MFRLFLLVYVLAISGFSQLNEKVIQVDLTTFKSDSVWYGPWISLTDGENIKVTAMFNDTSSSGYASDSVAAKLGYQYGATYISYSGLSTTVSEGPPIFYDSIRTASGRFTTTTWLTADADSFPATMLDSSGAIGYAFNVKRFQNIYVNSLVRPVFVGLTGNKIGVPLRVRCVVTQRKWALAGKN